jgi:RimK family alpha-L-glutamate ligase
MKFYKISEDRYLMTDGEMVCEVNKDVVLSQDTSKIKRFILIGEKYYKSIQLLSKKGIKTDYADPEKLEYIIEDDVIKVNDKEYSFEVSKDDVGSTVVFIKSGYSKPELSYLYDQFDKFGILVINNPNRVAETSNKWITYEMLEKNDIPQPVSVLVDSNDVSKKDHDGLYKKLKNIYNKPNDNDKYVCKLLKGHGGRGVFVCRHKNILSILQCIFAVKDNTKVMVQKCLDLKDGDIRANVLTINKKQKLINAVKRTKGNDKDFRTNLSLGGHAEEIELTKEQQKLAFKVAKLSGLTWAGVDIIEDTDDNMYVIEINGAPGTPFDIENQDDLLEKNTAFYADFVDLIDEMI